MKRKLTPVETQRENPSLFFSGALSPEEITSQFQAQIAANPIKVPDFLFQSIGALSPEYLTKVAESYLNHLVTAKMQYQAAAKACVDTRYLTKIDHDLSHLELIKAIDYLHEYLTPKKFNIYVDILFFYWDAIIGDKTINFIILKLVHKLSQDHIIAILDILSKNANLLLYKSITDPFSTNFIIRLMHTLDEDLNATIQDKTPIYNRVFTLIHDQYNRRYLQSIYPDEAAASNKLIAIITNSKISHELDSHNKIINLLIHHNEFDKLATMYSILSIQQRKAIADHYLVYLERSIASWSLDVNLYTSNKNILQFKNDFDQTNLIKFIEKFLEKDFRDEPVDKFINMGIALSGLIPASLDLRFINQIFAVLLLDADDDGNNRTAVYILLARNIEIVPVDLLENLLEMTFEFLNAQFIFNINLTSQLEKLTTLPQAERYWKEFTKAILIKLYNHVYNPQENITVDDIYASLLRIINLLPDSSFDLVVEKFHCKYITVHDAPIQKFLDIIGNRKKITSTSSQQLIADMLFAYQASFDNNLADMDVFVAGDESTLMRKRIVVICDAVNTPEFRSSMIDMIDLSVKKFYAAHATIISKFSNYMEFLLHTALKIYDGKISDIALENVLVIATEKHQKYFHATTQLLFKIYYDSLDNAELGNRIIPLLLPQALKGWSGKEDIRFLTPLVSAMPKVICQVAIDILKKYPNFNEILDHCYKMLKSCIPHLNYTDRMVAVSNLPDSTRRRMLILSTHAFNQAENRLQNETDIMTDVTSLAMSYNTM